LGAIFFLVIAVLAVLLGVVVYSQRRASAILRLPRVNFLILHPLSFYSLDMENQTAIKIDLPPELYVQTAYGYGPYRLKAVYDLGELDKRGGKVLMATVSDLLGLPVDGWLESWRWQLPPKTSFNYHDWLLIFKNYSLLRPDKIKTINPADFWEDLVLANGETVKTLDPSKFDFLTDGLFWESALKRENLKVEVLNAGGTTGLGNKAARLLANMGLTVVRVDNAETPIGDCEVKSAKPSLTADRVARIFGCRLMTKEADRADITLILRVLHPGE
jgi:hypothetical protein